MTEELNNNPVTPEVAPEAVAAPVTETSAPAPVAVEKPPETPVEAPAAEAKPVEPSKPETVLGEALDKETKAPEKPAEAAPAEAETKTAEAPKATEESKPEGQSDEPAPPPVYEAWTLPEEVTLDEATSKQFTDILADFEINSKADHAAVQSLGQKAVDLYISEQKKFAENLVNFYTQNWEKQKIQWKDQFLADPEIGGNRSQTTVDSALNFIRTHGGTPEQQAEFKNLMETSGLGNHPAMIRLLANAGRNLSEGKPLAAQRPVSAPKSKVSTLYGKTN